MVFLIQSVKFTAVKSTFDMFEFFIRVYSDFIKRARRKRPSADIAFTSKSMDQKLLDVFFWIKLLFRNDQITIKSTKLQKAKK